jgi:hypothetical protein
MSAGCCQRALVDESGIINAPIGTHNTSEMVAVLGTPCAIPLRNSNYIISFEFILRKARMKSEHVREGILE